MDWTTRLIMPALDLFVAEVDKQLASLGAARNGAASAELVDLRRRITYADEHTQTHIRQQERQARNAKERTNAQAKPN